MEKYLIYDKNFDLVKRFGVERYDILTFKNLNNHIISRAWDVLTPDHVLNGIAAEFIIDDCIIIRMGLLSENVVFRVGNLINNTFEHLNEENLFAETLHHISCAMRTGDVRMCRKLADEWNLRGKIWKYSEAHRFLINNH